jgi:hypothetical protein
MSIGGTLKPRADSRSADSRSCNYDQSGDTRTGDEELVIPPPDTINGRAARAIADVFGCSVEEAHRVLVLGIIARKAERTPVGPSTTETLGRGTY